MKWPWQRGAAAATELPEEQQQRTSAQQSEAEDSRTFQEPAPTSAPAVASAQPVQRPSVNVDEIENKAVEALQTCYDPEIPVNIYELGLIYDVRVSATGEVHVVMTLTSPNCPVAVELPLEVESKMRSIPGVTNAKVEITFDPPWEPARMSEAARLQLGML